MFVAHVPPEQWIALYGPDRQLIGTMRLSQQKNGRMGLVLDFPKEYRFNTRFTKKATAPVVCAAPQMFGDYEPPDFDVPEDADNL